MAESVTLPDPGNLEEIQNLIRLHENHMPGGSREYRLLLELLKNPDNSPEHPYRQMFKELFSAFDRIPRNVSLTLLENKV